MKLPLKRCFVALIAVLVACSSSSSSPEANLSTIPADTEDGGTTTPGRTDGGATTSPDDASSPTDGSSGTCPAYTGTNVWCKERAAVCKRCEAELLPCEKAIVGTCDQLAANFSTAMISVLAECEKNRPCKQATELDKKCLNEGIAKAAPSAAQIALRTAYCDKCDPGSPTCADSFYSRQPFGDGAFVFDYNDAITDEIRTTCVSAAGADCGRWVLCAAGVLDARLDLPKLCEDGGAQ